MSDSKLSDGHRPLVYLSSPYSEGCRSQNVMYHCEVYLKMVQDAVVTPYAPLLAHFVTGQEKIPWGRWMELQMGVMERCDALYTFNVEMQFAGERYTLEDSDGRDIEVARMRELRLPVFMELVQLYAWARGER